MLLDAFHDGFSEIVPSFLRGPKGVSVNNIARMSGTMISSEIQQVDPQNSKMHRVFHIEVRILQHCFH